MKAKIIKVFKMDIVCGYKIGDLVEVDIVNSDWYEDDKSILHKSQLEFVEGK